MKTWAWPETHEVLALHRRLLADHGGAEGLRDAGLLESALHRPRHHAHHGAADVCQLAAELTTGLVKNHPFVAGNRRIGFLIGLLFLELNGRQFEATQEEATTAMIALAAGRIGEAEYRSFLEAHSTKHHRAR